LAIIIDTNKAIIKALSLILHSIPLGIANCLHTAAATAWTEGVLFST